jgi:hypothetical protein
MNEIRGDEYALTYDSATATLRCEGALRLYGASGWTAIDHLLEQIANQQAPVLTLDLRALEFLNSAGINVFSKLMITIRTRGASQVIIRGNPRIAWHIRTLENFHRLLPTLQVQFE